MAIVGNRFYNSPELGAAFSNIASLFGPPDSGDLVNYAQAAGLRQKTDIINSLRGDPRYQGADGGILADLFNPDQSFYAVDQNNATTRRGQDLTATTSRANNLQDNRFGVLKEMFGPLNQGQVRPELPAGIAGQFELPAFPAVAGAPKPLSTDEVEAQQLIELLDKGTLTGADFAADFKSDTPVETVMVDGIPTVVRRSDAVGKQPFINKGAEAKPDIFNYATGDGRRGTAIYNGETLVDAVTKQPLPPDVSLYKATAQGTVDQIGAGTTSNRTEAQKIRSQVSNANSLVNQLETIVTSNPAATGLAGDIVSFTQDAKQVVREFAETFGEDDSAPISAEEMQAISARVLGPDNGQYNPAYRQARALMLELAYANASMNNPGGEVSRFALERELEALGQGMVGNDQGVLAVIEIARGRMKRKLEQADVLDGTAEPLTPDQIGQGGVEEWDFDANGNLVQVR